MMRALALTTRGDFGAARAAIDEARQIAEANAVTAWLPSVCTTWGWIAAETGHPEEGIACIERALGLQEALGLKGQLPTSHLRLAEAHLAASHYELAAVAARRARDLAESQGDHGRAARALRVLADAGVETADDGAEALYRELQRVAGDRDLRPLQAHAHLGLARLSHRAGPPGEAGDHLTTAIAVYCDMGMSHWVERARALCP